MFISNKEKQSILERIQKLEGRVKHLEHEAKVHEVKRELVKFGIDFDEVNEDPCFHDWLKEPFDSGDKYRDGMTRQAVLKMDFDRGNASYVSDIFLDFVTSNNAPPLLKRGI